MKNFWIISKHDLLIWALFLVSILLFDGYLIARKEFQLPLRYYDSSFSIFLAKKLFTEKRINLRYLGIRQKMGVPIFVYPFLIKIFSELFGDYGVYILIILSFMVASYAFRRLLLAYGIGHNLGLCLLMVVFPLKWSLLKNTASSTCLFFGLICFCFIFYRHNKFVLLLFTLILCIFTRVEGIMLSFVFFLLYIIKFSFKRVFLIGCLISLYIFILSINDINFEKYLILLYYPFSFKLNETFSLNPLNYYLKNAESISQLRNAHSYLQLYIPLIFSGVLLLFSELQIGIFILTWVIFSLFINSEYIFYFLVPSQIFAYLIGFGHIYRGRKATIFILLFLFIYSFVYSIQEISK